MKFQVAPFHIQFREHDRLLLDLVVHPQAAELVVVVLDIVVADRLVEEHAVCAGARAVVFEGQRRVSVDGQEFGRAFAEVFDGDLVAGQNGDLFQLDVGLREHDLEDVVVLAHTVGRVERGDIDPAATLDFCRVYRFHVYAEVVLLEAGRQRNVWQLKRFVRFQLLQYLEVDKRDGGTDELALVFLPETHFADTFQFVLAPFGSSAWDLVPQHNGADILVFEVVARRILLVHGLLPHLVEEVHAGWSVMTYNALINYGVAPFRVFRVI